MRRSVGVWIYFLLVLCVASFLLFFRLGDRSFRNPDEGRYAEIAREMAVSNEWVEPRLYGVDYLRKPPLFYWLVALSFKVFGFNEWAARLVPAIFALAGVAMTFGFTWRCFGAETAFLASLILATNAWYVQLGRYLVIDMVFSFFVAAAVYCFFLGTRENERAPGYFAGFFALMGLAFLTKGLAGVVLPGLAVMAYGLTTRRPAIPARPARFAGATARRAGGRRPRDWAMGFLIFAVIALPWFFRVAARKPEFLRLFFLHEHVERFLSAHFEHQEPWFYYLWALPAMLIPWTVFAVPLFRASARSRDHAFLAGWTGAVIFFFSLSRSKLVTYLLPCLPVLSVLIGDAWVHWPGRRKGKIFYALVGTSALAALSISWILEGTNGDYTTRPFAQVLRSRLPAQPAGGRGDEKVFIYGKPSAFYDFRFYLNYPVKLAGLEGELALAAGDKEVGLTYCLIRKSDFETLGEDVRRGAVIIHQDKRKILFQSGVAPPPPGGGGVMG